MDFHLVTLNRIPETDPYWSAKPPTTRKECLHQQVTRAVPDFQCHLGPRQIVRRSQASYANPVYVHSTIPDEPSFQLAGPFSNLQFQTILF